VLLSDALRLPEGLDWDECIIRIKERDVYSIDKIVKSISGQKEIAMRSRCLEAYRMFSGDNIVSSIRRVYKEIL
jgi:hypothetical protein